MGGKRWSSALLRGAGEARTCLGVRGCGRGMKTSVFTHLEVDGPAREQPSGQRPGEGVASAAPAGLLLSEGVFLGHELVLADCWVLGSLLVGSCGSSREGSGSSSEF